MKFILVAFAAAIQYSREACTSCVWKDGACIATGKELGQNCRQTFEFGAASCGELTKEGPTLCAAHLAKLEAEAAK